MASVQTQVMVTFPMIKCLPLHLRAVWLRYAPVRLGNMTVD